MPEPRVGDLYVLREAIDRPQGHFARVYLADDLRNHCQVAFKVLREEHLALGEREKKRKFQSFVNEARLLTELADLDHIMRLLSCGYLKADGDTEVTPLPCSLEEFTKLLPDAMKQNWRPYLALGLLSSKDSLFRMLDHKAGGRRLTTEEALRMSIQLAELYAKIHSRGIVYWDAKPEHVYWQRESEQAVLIDWNVSGYTSNHDARVKVSEDLLLLGQCILYPAFVGLDFVTGQTPEAKPTGTVAGVRTRLSFDRSVSFYSQDEWLDQPVKRVLQRVVSRNGYESAQQLVDDLNECGFELGWDLSTKKHAERDSQVLSHQDMIKALALIGNAQENLQQARLLLEQAALRFPLHDREIQRLINESTDFWKKRVIP